MAEGQGNGNDSPERDSAWRPAPEDGTPEAGTEPGTGEAPAPGGSWVPTPMTSPAGDAGQQPPGQPGPSPQQDPAAPSATDQPGPGAPAFPGQPVPGPQQAPAIQQASPQAGPGPQSPSQHAPSAPSAPGQPGPGALALPGQPGPGALTATDQPGPGAPAATDQPGSAPQPGSGEPGTPPYPAPEIRPLGGPVTSRQAEPGNQPAAGAAPQPWMPPGAPYGQPALGAQPPPGQAPYGTPPPHTAAQGEQPSYGAPQGSGQPQYGTAQDGQPPHGASQPYAGQAPNPGQPGGQAFYAGPPAYPGQPAQPGQPAYPGQPPYAGQPSYGGQPPYGQAPYVGQPPYGSQASYGQPSYGETAWQPQGVTSPVPPLPGEIPSAVPPSSEGHWLPPGGYAGPPPSGPPPSRGWLGRALVYIVVAVLAAAAGAGAVFALRGAAGQAPASSVSSQVIPKPKANRAGSRAIGGINVSAVARKVEQGLVDITSYVHLQQQVFEGTGMILTPGGLVLTNNHVIKGSTRVRVTVVTTGKQYAAQVVGTDNSQDVALLRLVGASGLKTIQPGDSNKVKLGTPVIALGNAGGTGGLPTVSQPGTITSLNRTIQASDAGSRTTETLHHMFQSSAPIAEGDSGGALANSAGQVIAMNTAANSQNIGGPGTSQGYAIPIDRALAIVRLMAAGHASSTIQLGQPAFLGIAIATTTSGATSNATSPQVQLRQFQAIARSGFGAVNSSGRCLPNANVNPVPGSIAPAKSGALIGAVFCNEPATKAGAQAGDVITAVDGHAVTSASSLHAVIHTYRPGQAVTLTVVAPNGQQQHISFRLAAGPAA